MAMKFHWRLLHGGETGGDTRAGAWVRRASGLPDLPAQIDFCKQAERAGMTGLLTDVGAAKPDSVLLSTALGLATERIELIIAFRSNFCSPTFFIQQLNTASQMIEGRLSLNIVAGHSPAEQRYYGDFLPHDERYSRTEEFLAVCRALWDANGEPVSFRGAFYEIEGARLNTPYRSPHRSFPEIFIAGGSEQARDLAIRQGTLWMRLADTPEKIAEEAKPVLDTGTEVGLRLAVVARPTRREALAAANALITGLDESLGDAQRVEKNFTKRSDSVSIKKTYAMAREEWLTPTLWTGAVRTHGAPAIAVVGDAQEVAAAFLDYGRAGVTQFILSGWPKTEEMVFFGEHVLPLIRREEGGAGPG